MSVTAAPPLSLLFVCTGNICRSPTAEGVMRHLLKGAGIADRVLVDSAGLQGDWHAGAPPDRRSAAHAATRGYSLSGIQARQMHAADLHRFSRIIAMDRGHLAALERLAASLKPDPPPVIGLLPHGVPVPDPYYGGAEGFDHVLDLIEQGCALLLDQMQARLADPTP